MSTPKSQRSDPLDSSSSTLLPPASPSRHPSAYSGSDGASAAPASASATYAAFSPATLATSAPTAASAAKRRSTILVHQKSPLLLATPPQITRALAYSHPFLLPLNKLAGLLSWSTDDPWESFLLVAGFWAVVLYGDVVVRVVGPVVLVLTLIAAMYGRRFSPLSSSGYSEAGQAPAADGSVTSASAGQKPAKLKKKNGGKAAATTDPSTGSGRGGRLDATATGHQRNQSSLSGISNTRHQKTLDEIVDTLKEFTARCNLLLEPALELTDFLSTQRTPTSATTRPALTTLLVRIMLCTPFWVALTLPPLHIVTTRRVVLVLGTVALTWHARVMRVGRTLLWRSLTVRRLAALVTGLEFQGPLRPGTASPLSADASGGVGIVPAGGKTATKATATHAPQHESELTRALRRERIGQDSGVRFTFILYENQRRWVGLGWTSSLFAYERSAWTDEHNNVVPSRDKFELPDVDHGSHVRWRWAPESRWRVDGVSDDAVRGTTGKGQHEWDYDGAGGRMGWIYYDNKWQNGRRGVDGWGRWTRRRKWYRDAELVDSENRGDAEEEADTDGEADSHDSEASNNQGRLGGEYTPTPSPKPALPKRPSNPPPLLGQQQPTSSTHMDTQSAPDLAEGSSTAALEKGGEKDDEYDSASILSSSSRSARFRAPSLRRRLTDTSRSAGSSAASASAGRPRRTSEAAGDDDAVSLGTQVDLEIQGAGKEGGSWGFGDEVRMGLE